MHRYIRAALAAGWGLWGCVMAHAQVADGQAAQAAQAAQVAAFMQGKYIATANGAFFADKVTAAIDAQGRLSLRADVAPLYEVNSTQGPYRPDSSVDYWTLDIAADAPCGPTTLPTRIEDTDLSVLVGERFLNLREAIEGVVADPPEFTTGNRPLIMSPADLARTRQCKDRVAARLNALPFEAIQVFSGQTLLTEVRRPLGDVTRYEFDLGADERVTHLSVEPRPGRARPLSVSVRMVSVMRCDYEGPHIELDDWKQGLSRPRALHRVGKVFYVDDPVPVNGQDPIAAPVFPAYTQAELRRAINQHWGKPGLAPRREARPCGAFLRGYRFKIEGGAGVAHQIDVYFPGGC